PQGLAPRCASTTCRKTGRPASILFSLFLSSFPSNFFLLGCGRIIITANHCLKYGHMKCRKRDNLFRIFSSVGDLSCLFVTKEILICWETVICDSIYLPDRTSY